MRNKNACNVGPFEDLSYIGRFFQLLLSCFLGVRVLCYGFLSSVTDENFSHIDPKLTLFYKSNTSFLQESNEWQSMANPKLSFFHTSFLNIFTDHHSV